MNKNILRRALVVGLLTLTLPQFAHAAPTAAKAVKAAVSSALNFEATPSGSLEFLALGKPSLLRIRGKGEAPKGSVKVEGGRFSGTFTFNLKSLDTGIDLRTEHMKNKYLQVDQHPEAKLVLTDVKLPESWTLENPQAEDIPFQGLLTLHGQEKPVSGTFTTKATDGHLGVDAKFDVNIGDFGIETPSYAGIKVTDSVNVSVAFPELKKVTAPVTQ